MESVDTSPTPKDLADDLKQIVHQLERWERLPLPSLRALPSIRLWTPPSPGVAAHYAGAPNRAICAAITQRIMEAIEAVELQEDRESLTSILTFDEPKLTLKERHEKAAKQRDVGTESFRTSSERVLLRELAEEIVRGEFMWTANEIATLRSLAHT